MFAFPILAGLLLGPATSLDPATFALASAPDGAGRTPGERTWLGVLLAISGAILIRRS